MNAKHAEDERIPKLPRPRTSETGSEALRVIEPSFEAEESVSMSLVDGSLRRLHGLMQSLNETPEDIKSACELAKQIQSLCRLKLDCYRMLKGK